MSEFTPTLEAKHIAELNAAPLFFVATAPNDGRINLSPKGLDCLRILSPSQLAYLDLTGSGNETAAHLLENGRITLMVCSFTRTANILRVYGQGRSVQPADGDWAEYAAHFDILPGTRQIFVIDVGSVQTSCGWAIPEMALVKERQTLIKYAVNAGEDGLLKSRRKNRISIDGQPTGITNFSQD